MCSWMTTQAHHAPIITPIGSVELRQLTTGCHPPQATDPVGVIAFSYTAARWGIAASPAALSFIKGRARAKAPYQQDRILAVAQPPKTPVVLRDSGGLTSNRKRHAPIRGDGTRAVGWGIWLNSSEEACGP